MTAGVPPAVVPARWWSPARLCQLIAVVVALGTGLVVAYAPLGTQGGSSASTDGGVTTYTTEQHGVSLASQLGPGAVLLIGIPVLLTLIPVPFRGTAHVVASWVATVLTGMGCVVALLSVGVFYLPTLGLLTVAALLATLRRPATS